MYYRLNDGPNGSGDDWCWVSEGQVRPFFKRGEKEGVSCHPEFSCRVPNSQAQVSYHNPHCSMIRSLIEVYTVATKILPRRDSLHEE